MRHPVNPLHSLHPLLVVLALLLGACSSASETVQATAPAPAPNNSAIPRITVYPIPDAINTSPWTVQFENTFLPIERYPGAAAIDYARFQSGVQGAAHVTITLGGKEKAQFEIAPASVKFEQQGNSVSLDLPADEHIRLVARRGGKALAPLFVFRELDSFSPFNDKGRQRPLVLIDAPEPGAAAAGHTAKIQALLDKASVNQGSSIVMCAGIHPIQGLVFKNDVRIYFEPGAIWKSDGDLTGWNRAGGAPVLLNMQGARNITLAGYGVIEGNFSAAKGAAPVLIDIRDAENIRLQNLILRGMNDVRVENSAKVVLDHLRLLPGTRAITPKSSTDVEITNFVLMRNP